MKKYIVPPSNDVNPLERYEDGKWTRIQFMDVKEGDILRIYNHEFKVQPVGRNGVIVASSDGFLNEDGIATFQCEIDENLIPDI